MANNDRFSNENDPGRIGTRFFENTFKDKAMRKVKSDHYTVFQMYCENYVYHRLERLKKALTDKNLMFKFDGNKYAVFPLDVKDGDGLPIKDYVLTLEQLEEFAENV